METGRAAMDLLSRELETAMATGQIGTNTNCFHMTNTVSVYNTTTRDGFTMRLNDGTTRTNVLEDLFFMSRSNNWWTAYGYFVGAVSNNMIVTNVVWKSGMGTLYRSSAQNVLQGDPAQMKPLMQFRDESQFYALVQNLVFGRWYLTNSYQIADGVVHFRVRPLDADGQVLRPYMLDRNLNVQTNYNVLNELNPIAHEYQMRFASNQLPAFLELELGLLPPQVLQRVRAIENAEAQRNYLTNQANAVVLFSKVIRLRNAQNER